MEGAVKTKPQSIASMPGIPTWGWMCDKFWGDQPSDITNISNQLQPKKAWLCPCYSKTFRGLGTKKVGNLPFGVLCSFPTSNRTNHTPKKIRSKEGYHHGFPQNKYQTKLKQTQWFHDTNPPHFTHAEQTGIHEDWHHAELPAGAMNWTLGVQRPFEIAPAVFFLENQLRPSIFRGSQRQQFLDAAYLHSIHPKPFLGGPSKYLKIQPNISSLNVKKAWSIPCMNAEYPTPVLFCCCRPAYPSFPSARQGWAQPLASVRSIRRSSKIILDHLNVSPLWYIIIS